MTKQIAERILITTCPVCDSKPAPAGVTETYALRIAQERVAIDFAVCPACGFVFQQNPLTREMLRQYYSNSPRFRSQTTNESEDALRRAQLAFIEAGRVRGPVGSVLDIGADMGKLLDLFWERGWKTAYIEDSEYARAYLDAAGRHIEIVELRDTDRFDVVVLSQVLEHIVQPRQFLLNLHRHLVEDGHLFIEVPCHALWDATEYGFSFEHVNYFGPATMSELLKRSGYLAECVQVSSDARYFGGKFTIVRALARRADIPADVADAVRRHNAREFHARFAAIRDLAVEHRLGNKGALAFYGAGELADQVLSITGIGPREVVTILDSDPGKHGSMLHSVPISAPAALLESDVATVVILSSAETAIRQTIADLGFSGRVVSWAELADHANHTAC